MTGALPADVLLGMTLAALAAAVVAWILRGAGIAGGRPAAAVVGGLIAGVLLGPAVLGQSAPRLHERLYVGGIPERHALESLLARQAADRLALQAAPSGAADPDELRARHAAEQAPLVDALNAARAQHRSRLGTAAAALLAAGIGLAAWCGRRPAGLASAPLAAAIALGAELGVMVLIGRFFGLPWGLTVGLAATGACGSAFAGVPMRWVPRAGRSAPALTTGVWAFVLACAAIVLAADPGRWPAALLPAGAMLIGLIAGGAARRGQSARRAVRAALANAIIPAAVAVAALHVEWWRFADDGRAWPLVLTVTLVAGNAAIVGLWLALRRIPDPPTYTDLVGWHATGFSATQACVATLLPATGLCDPSTSAGSAVLAGILLSAAVGETTIALLGATLAGHPETHRSEPPAN